MKRFYKEVTLGGEDGAWQVRLDGRGVKTQGGAQQLVPTRQLAELLAGEWQAQGEKINLRSFVFRDLADFAIDRLPRERDASVAKLLEYAETDTLCYRADPGDALFERQTELWEPLVLACEARHGITLERASGIIHRPQPEASIAALRVRLDGLDDFTLAALFTLTSLAASLVVALATLEEGADIPALFDAANAEEDWQAELWGWDHEVEEARKLKLGAFQQAAQFLEALR